MNLISKILQKINIKPIKIEGPFRGYRNSSYKIITKNDIFNLVIFNQENSLIEKIKIQSQICTELAKSNLTFQIRYPKSRIICICRDTLQCVSTQYACLYNYIEGKTISWESYTAQRLKQIGKSLAELHSNLQALNIKQELVYNLPNQKQICLEQVVEMKNYFARKEVRLAMYQKLGIILNINFDKLESLISEIEDSNEILHMDFVRGNIIWDDKVQNKIVGIIDFEKMSRGKGEFDIARTLAFLIIDSKYKTETEVRIKFLASYANNFDINLVEKLVRFFFLYDFYKFLKHNPYEFLSENKHFVRTRDYLLRRKLISIKD